MSTFFKFGFFQCCLDGFSIIDLENKVDKGPKNSIFIIPIDLKFTVDAKILYETETRAINYELKITGRHRTHNLLASSEL